jgi:hypothetical protein
MALISCPECKKQVSTLASACPHCGCPISVSAQAPRPRAVTQEAPSPKAGSGFGVGCLILVILALAVGGFLAFTNPTESDMRKKIAEDGWVPVGFERTNLIIFNWVSIEGATGAKAKYMGIGGQIFKLQ